MGAGAWRVLFARHPGEGRDPVAVAPARPLLVLLTLLLLVIPAKARIEGLFTLYRMSPSDVSHCSSSRPKPESRVTSFLAPHPCESGNPWTFHALPEIAQPRCLEPLLVIRAKAGIHFAVALDRHPRAGGDPWTFYALPVRLNSDSQRFRPSKAGRITFVADPKSDWIPFGQT